MKLNIVVDGRSNAFEVPDNLLTEAQAFFNKLDADMDNNTALHTLLIHYS